MTVENIKNLVISADPDAKHYEWAPGGGPYTTWQERSLLPIMADDKHVEGWAFTIDHFTKDEFSEAPVAIRRALDAAPGVAYAYERDYEADTGYIHHIFTCEGI